MHDLSSPAYPLSAAPMQAAAAVAAAAAMLAALGFCVSVAASARERRPQRALLGALGVPAVTQAWLFCAEEALVSVPAAAVGLVIGITLAHLVVPALTVTATGGRCGNPGCHCHRPQDPGHGPNFRLTYKENGKTVTESFASPAARRKTEREIEEYRRWQQLSREFVGVNARLCRLRPAEEPERTAEKKKRQKRSNRKSGEK